MCRGLIDGRHVPVEVREDPDPVGGAVVESFLQLLVEGEGNLLSWMKYGAALARKNKAEVKLGRHWQDCDDAAEAFDKAWAELEQSVKTLRAKMAASGWFP